MARHAFTEPAERFNPWQAELDDAYDAYRADPLMNLREYHAIADAINAKWQRIKSIKEQVK